MDAINNIIDTGFEYQMRLELSAYLLGYGCSLDMIIREKEFLVTGV